MLKRQNWPYRPVLYLSASSFRKVTRARSVDHRCLFQAMAMRWSTQIGHVGTIGYGTKTDKVGQSQEGDQGQVGGPQVPLPGHGDEIENPNWASIERGTRD